MKKAIYDLFVVVVLGSCLLVGESVNAAENPVNLDLDKSIEMALQNNLSIVQANDSKLKAEWGVKEAKRSQGPTFTWAATVHHIGGDDYSQKRAAHSTNPALPAYDNEVANTLSLSMPLYTGGSLKSKIASAEYGVDASTLQLESTKQDVRYKTIEAYFKALQTKSLVTVREQAIKTGMEHLDNVNIQYEIGVVAKADVLESEVQLANQKKELNTVTGDYHNAKASLNNVIGLPVMTETNLVDEVDYMSYDGIPLEQCIEYAHLNHPGGLAQEYAVKMAAETCKLAKANYRPQVSGVVKKVVTGEGEQFYDQDHSSSWKFGVEATWTVFDNQINAAKIKEAEMDLLNAQAKAKQTWENVDLGVIANYNSMCKARENILICKEAVEKAKESYEIANILYEEGVNTNDNVMRSQDKLMEAQNNYYTSLYDYEIDIAKLDQAMGRPVELDATLYREALSKEKR